MSRQSDARDAEHRRQIHANENDVIDAARATDPDDHSPRAEYVREVAEDIIARRAADN